MLILRGKIVILTMFAWVVPAGSVAGMCEDGAGGGGHEPDVQGQEVGGPDVFDSHSFGEELGEERANDSLGKNKLVQ